MPQFIAYLAPDLRLRLGLFALVDLPHAHKPLKTRPPGTIFVSISVYMRLDIYGDRSHDFTVSSAVFQHLNKRQPKMTYISALGA